MGMNSRAFPFRLYVPVTITNGIERVMLACMWNIDVEMLVTLKDLRPSSFEDL